MIRTRSNLPPVGFRAGHVPLNVNTIILPDMSWKQRSVSLHTHTRLGDHTQTVLPGWRWRRSSSATRRQTKAVRRSLSFLSAPVLPVSSLLSKIKQARLPCACFQCRDPFGSTQLHTPNTPPNFSFCLFVCFFYIDFCVCVCGGDLQYNWGWFAF